MVSIRAGVKGMKNDLEKKILKNEIVKRVINQQIKGLEKYGDTVDPYTLTSKEWLEHLAEELVDAHVYVQCLIYSLDNEKGEK